MKLELKHLAPYLPYKLQYLSFDEIFQLDGLDVNNDAFNADSGEIDIDLIKPILRPLSDLTNQEWLNIILGSAMCEAGFNVFYIQQPSGFPDFWYQDSKGKLTDKFGLTEINKLLENHFDVFGLIPSGLAIDINTLKK